MIAQRGVEISMHHGEPIEPKYLQARTVIPDVTITGWHAAVSRAGATTDVKLTATKEEPRTVFAGQSNAVQSPLQVLSEPRVWRSFADSSGLPEGLPDSAIVDKEQAALLGLHGAVLADIVNTAADTAPDAFSNNSPYTTYAWYGDLIHPERPIPPAVPVISQ